MSINKSTVIASLTAILLASSSAYAADVNGKGSTKDADIYGTPKTDSRSGFYISGNLGIASGDREVRGSVTGERYPLGTYDPEDPETFVQSYELKEGLVEGPLNVNHFLPFGKDDSFDSTVFGGEVSYLVHIPSTRFGVELGLGGTVYTNSDTTVTFSGIPTDFPGTEHEAPSYDSVSGSAKFERDFDIDLVAKGHFFVTNDLSIYGGGGISWARANLKGGHDNTNTPEGTYDNAYDENDSAFGYVLVAGAQYWVTDRIVVGLDYSYKNHEFGFNSSSSLDTDDDGAVRRKTGDHVDVEDEVHTVKAKIGFKLN